MTGIVIDQATFARWIRKLNGTDPGPDDPWRPGYRCNTTDGIRLRTRRSRRRCLLGDIRRITDAKGVVIDLGFAGRLLHFRRRL
ncbi:MAG: hypothetical protein R2710_04275 [Acidimicrobiales bacterium]